MFLLEPTNAEGCFVLASSVAARSVYHTGNLCCCIKRKEKYDQSLYGASFYKVGGFCYPIQHNCQQLNAMQLRNSTFVRTIGRSL